MVFFVAVVNCKLFTDKFIVMGKAILANAVMVPRIAQVLYIDAVLIKMMIKHSLLLLSPYL